MTTDLSIIILAAGKGTRMKSDLSKVLHKVAGLEMINHVIMTAKRLNPKDLAVVISDELSAYQDQIKAFHDDIDIKFVIQNERKGTGHAALIGLSALGDKSEKRSDKILILYGDTPLLEVETLSEMTQSLGENAVCVLGFESQFENQYGRLVVNENDDLERIVEFKDANLEEKVIELCNSGVVAVLGDKFDEFLSKIDDNNASGEYYLTDIVKIARDSDLKCGYVLTDEEEVLGVNSRVELARVEDIKQNKMRHEFMTNGVTLLDPFSVYFSYDTKIENDVIIHQNVVFGPNVEIKSGSEIKSFSHVEGAKIDNNVVVGPFARLRPGSELEKNVKIGNFVEVKKSKLEQGAKVNHLSYIGDSEIGQNSNIGAGTITCNYDGFNKSKTKVGANVFVGSNSALVAPVEIEDNAMVGAGSVITKNVAQDDLAVARCQQKNLTKAAKKFRDAKSKND